MEAAKSKRSTAKKDVSVAARHLRTGVDNEMSSVPELVSKLDNKFLIFTDICEEYRSICDKEKTAPEDTIVNGLDIESYEAEVKSVFMSAMSHYRSTVTPSFATVPSQSSISFKRQLPPKFSGERRDWPEFKRLWTEVVIPSLGNNSMLCAQQLKDACRGGQGFPRD